jgi:hypothetical protein
MDPSLEQFAAVFEHRSHTIQRRPLGHVALHGGEGRFEEAAAVDNGGDEVVAHRGAAAAALALR